MFEYLFPFNSFLGKFDVLFTHQSLLLLLQNHIITNLELVRVKTRKDFDGRDTIPNSGQ